MICEPVEPESGLTWTGLGTVLILFFSAESFVMQTIRLVSECW